MTIQEILVRIEDATHYAPKKAGAGFLCRCPGHADSKPSLSVSKGNDGRILMKCHAGCTFETVVSALNVTPADLVGKNGEANAPRGRPPKFTIATTYDYCDTNGALLFQVCRMQPKDFRQRRPDKSSADGWTWNLKGVRQVPYRLAEFIVAMKRGECVFVVEGEKDVETLRAHGFVATCNAGGAKKWRTEFSSYFDGAQSVVVIADKDAPGRAHADDVAAKLTPIVRNLKVIELPDVGTITVKDASDFFAAGGSAEQLRELVSAADASRPKPGLTPCEWFKQRFPKLAERRGEPLHEVLSAKQLKVCDTCEDFMAAMLGPDGMPDAPTVYVPGEERFFTYNPESGIFERRREEDISARVSDIYLACVRECSETADVSRLQFPMRDSAALTGVVKRAKALLAAPENFFTHGRSEHLPLANGMLRLRDRALVPFSPEFGCRHKLSVAYDASADCPQFKERLLMQALSPSDISLIQRWSGLALLGVNLSQRMLLLTGTAGGGKSTLVSVITGIVGLGNVGMLRTELLGDRFELGRLMDKTLLYGADVQEDFLTRKTASHLKSLTGGDVMTAEFKNSNESPQFKCQFNVIVTSNSRLTVYLEGDADAWRRRLAIVHFEKQKPTNPIPNFSERIIAEEGSGVLNFMLNGLETLRDANWKLELSETQQRRVDDLLLESDAHHVFVKECLTKDSNAHGMTKADVYNAFVSYCERRSWIAMSKNRFGKLGADAITQTFGITVRGDITGEDEKQNDGWKSLRLKTEVERQL